MWILAITLDSATLLGLAAIVTAIGGLASTIMALRKDRSEEHQKCLERLKEARAEAERLAQEVHGRRMRGELPPPKEPGGEAPKE